jgi:hypothetical protein
MIICKLLAKAYPKGLTIEEIVEQGSESHSLMKSNSWVESMLGIHDGIKDPERGDILCCTMHNERIRLDPSRKKYISSPAYGNGFALLFNEWLAEEGLSHLIGFKPLEPSNSTMCPQGILWSEIPGPFLNKNCSWDCESNLCYRSCGLDKSNAFRAWKQGGRKPFLDPP